MPLITDRVRSTKGRALSLEAAVAEGVQIFVGAIVTTSASGYAQPATDTTGASLLGIGAIGVDNTEGLDGRRDVTVDRGHL